MLGIRERGRVSQFSVKIVLSDSAEKLRRGYLLCFIKYLVNIHKIKNLWIRRGGGGGVREYHNIVENFLSHSAEKFRRGTVLCCVSEKFW